MSADDQTIWPTRITKDQRLYVCRPHGRDWREALMNYHQVEQGGAPAKLWEVIGGEPWRANDMLITYMQTSPMMIVHLDVLSTASTAKGGIDYDGLCHFVHGVSLDLVNQRLGFELQTVDLYWEAPEARRIVKALKQEYELGSTLFGDNRVAEALKIHSAQQSDS
ncbi:hypothetical protein [Williamsia sp.]|uniref:hypothetical protein n=1 Tax=Williamsia sp. TaxID=1872085 RepID=UPI001A1A14A4|nr:hypothetical protein [Williamsia sp.]MBJ7289185.1 hypothetical protein [Williamsia sp.]